jgi:hypothetical protein
MRAHLLPAAAGRHRGAVGRRLRHRGRGRALLGGLARLGLVALCARFGCLVFVVVFVVFILIVDLRAGGSRGGKGGGWLR